jgi:hypothetical protein
MTSFLGSQDQTWFGSLRQTGGGSFWLRPLAEVLAIPIGVLQAAVTATRNTRGTDQPAGQAEPAVTTWLTLHHGPRELLIALGGVEVDQIRTVLSPVRPPHPSDRPTPMEASE